MSKPIGVGVGTFVFKDGKFLMGKRISRHGTNTWSVPGGYVEFGETFEEASVREMLEETGLVIKNVRTIGVTNNIFSNEDKHTITVWTVSEYESGEPTILEPDKYIDLEWHTFDNLPSPLFLPSVELLKSKFIDDVKAEAEKSKQ